MQPSTTPSELPTLARLQAGLLELAAIVAATDDLPRLLDAIARTVSESLGWRTVVLNLYRPAWDDYQVQTVHGPVAAREALLGEATPWSSWEPLIADRFARRGAYLVRHGDYDWRTAQGHWYVPDLAPDSSAAAWHADDALLVPLRTTDGGVLGILSVDEPLSGRLPSDSEIDALVAVAAHAAVAVRHATQSASLRAHRAALHHFHTLFSRNRQSASAQELLDAVTRGIRTTLGFERVSVDLLEDGRESPVAELLDPRFESEGCFLLTAAQAAELAPSVDLGPPSRRSGRGPQAWQEHRLLVPFSAMTGDLLGILHVGDPRDRLLPSREVLQALRLFADRAVTELESAARLRELRYLADHDPLTGLLNRRAFMRTLEAETARTARYGSSFVLALCDVDALKLLNDDRGHPAGDRALRRVGRVLESGLRRSDGAFRLGGDEFALILVETTVEQTREITDRIEGALAVPGQDDGLVIRVSFGAVYSSGQDDDPESLLRRADEAMYSVKRARRDA